ncbi:MAG: insulinase family protein [Thermoanaerobaculia bacterium]|nr:insulinase family protein [Thermoanaerobaculia bacterium]
MIRSLDALFPLLPRTRHRRRLNNGLEVLVSSVPDTEVVSSCLWYRFGARDEAAEFYGGAHFLEHMMFKGSSQYGPGEVDERTQALGGTNNAFTSQDATAYYFKFSSPHWVEALKIEADRMRGLTLDPREVESERRVILEELSMYEADPWDALDQEVQTTLHGTHPYGRAILGTRDSLAGLGSDQLAAIHRRYYQPGNAVLVLTGAVDASALDEVERYFGDLPGESVQRASPSPGHRLLGWRRVERRRGTVPRFLMARLAPSADHPDHAGLRLATGILSAGRSSRLHRRLVEETELCQWVSADVTESQGPGTLTLATELHAGVELPRVEEEILEAIRSLAEDGISEAELERSQRFLASGWIFGHDQVHDQALSLGLGSALFEEDLVEEQLRRSLSLSVPDVEDVVRRWLGEESGVLGWSRPTAKPDIAEDGPESLVEVDDFV